MLDFLFWKPPTEGSLLWFLLQVEIGDCAAELACVGEWEHEGRDDCHLGLTLWTDVYPVALLGAHFTIEGETGVGVGAFDLDGVMTWSEGLPECEEMSLAAVSDFSVNWVGEIEVGDVVCEELRSEFFLLIVYLE